MPLFLKDYLDIVDDNHAIQIFFLIY